MEETENLNQNPKQTLTFTKQTQIKDLIEGDIISDLFVVKSKSSVQDYSNNTKFRFTLTLADKSGEIEAKYWGGESEEEVECLQQSLKSSDVIHITAKVQEYHGTLELNINNSGVTKLKTNQYHANFFIEESNKNLEELYTYIQQSISQMNNLQLKVLCQQFYNNQEFKMSLMHAPATKFHHHSYLGGLLEHIYNLLQHAKFLYNLHSELDEDLLTTIVVLACIGKIKNFTLHTTIDFSDDGHMLGDVVLSLQMVQEKIKLQEFDGGLRLKLLNAIISQQQKTSWGAIKRPATLEALTFAKIKELDASISQFISFQKNLNTDANFFYSKEFGNVTTR